MANDPTVAEMKTGMFIGQAYSKNVLMHTMSNLVIANFVNTNYRSDLRKGYVVNIPVMSEVSTGAITAGTELTAENAIGTPASITVDQWYGVRIEEDEMQMVQDHIKYLDVAAEACGYAVAKQVDSALAALFAHLGGYSDTAYGSDGQTLSDDIILYCVQTLDEADVPASPRALISDPSSKVDLLKIDKFVRNDYIKGGVIASGQFGEIYGMRVLLTNNLEDMGTGNCGCILHRDAIGCIIQKDIYSQRVPMPWEHQVIYQTKVLYGVGELRDAFGVPFYTRSD